LSNTETERRRNMKFSTRYIVALDVEVEADDIEMARIICDRLATDLDIKVSNKPEFYLEPLDRGVTQAIIEDKKAPDGANIKS
jgi:hypothetical protein